MTVDVIVKQVKNLANRFNLPGEIVPLTPFVLNSESLEAFCGALNLAENKIALASQLSSLLPLDLETAPLLDGSPILIAQDVHRTSVGRLVGTLACEYELVVDREETATKGLAREATRGATREATREATRGVTSLLYVRMVETMVEVGLVEEVGEIEGVVKEVDLGETCSNQS